MIFPEEALFCAPCNLSINPMTGACAGCALPIADLFAAVDGRARCRTCHRVPFTFARATAGFQYGEALAEELIAFCGQSLSRQKVPRSIDFEEQLPRLPTGKLYKRLLRDRYWGNKTSRIV